MSLMLVRWESLGEIPDSLLLWGGVALLVGSIVTSKLINMSRSTPILHYPCQPTSFNVYYELL